MFVLGFIVAWFVLGLFFYLRDSKGGWSIWDTKWDSILMMLPAVPMVFFVEFLQDKFSKNN